MELTVTLALLGILAVPFGQLVATQMQATVQADGGISAVNLARYEQERVNPNLLSFASLVDWCSVPGSQLPSEPHCPVSVASPNPYTGSSYVVARDVESQTPTDGSASTEMKRVTVKVFRSGDTVALVTVTTYVTNGVTFTP